MNASSYLIVLLQTTICLSTALLICAVARKSSNVRLLVSQIAIVICALFMVAGSWIQFRYTPMLTVKVAEPAKVSAPTNKPIQPTDVTTAIKDESTGAVPIAVQSRPSMSPDPIEASTPISLDALVKSTYILGLIASLLPILMGAFWIRKTRRHSTQITVGQTFDVLSRVANRHGIKVPALYSSKSIMIPFVTGLLRKQVFVPINWIDGQCDIACTAVIEHEVAHIVSRDLEWKFLCRVACALVWFQPLTWVMFRVMANASEELCDQSVLAAGVSKTTYANTLLEIREKAKRANVPGLVIGAVSRESNLAKRMKLILATDPTRIRRASRQALWFAVSTFAVMAATSTFVFGQRERSELSPFAGRSAAGAIALVDHFGQPVKNVQAWMLVGPSTERLAELRPLEVIGNQAMVTEQSIDKTRMGLLVVKSSDGNIDYKRIWPSAEKITQFNLALPSTIRGQIRMPSGLKVSPMVRAVMIVVKDEGFSGILPLFMFKEIAPTVRMSDDGHFEMKGIPAGSKVVLQVDDDRIAQDRQKMEVEIDDKGRSSFLQRQAHYGGTIKGRVLRDGKPVAGITIAAQGQTKSGWGQAVSDANGMYQISRLDPDKYNIATVLVKSQRKEFTAYATEGVLMKYGDVKDGINVSLIRGGTISGVLLDTKGKPVPNAPIGVFGEAHPGSSAMVGGETTDAQGHFEARVPPGDNQVYYMGGDGPGHPVTVHVSPDKDTKVTIEKPDPRPQYESKWLEPSKFPTKDIGFGPMRLKNGSVISLLYLCQGEGRNVKTWLPNGLSVNGNQFKEDLTAANYFASPPSKQQVLARVALTNIPLESVAYQIEATSISSWSSNISIGRNQTNRSDLLIAIRTNPSEVTSLRIGIPFGQIKQMGPYRVTYSGPAKPGRTLKIKRSSGEMQEFELQVPQEYLERYIDMQAIDDKGKHLTPILRSVPMRQPNTDNVHISYTFRSANLIKGIKATYQQVEWVTFKDVHTKPGQN